MLVQEMDNWEMEMMDMMDSNTFMMYVMIDKQDKPESLPKEQILNW
jgi:hypothetical protein